MNLREAIDELIADLTDTAVINGNARAFELVLRAAEILIKEHGPNYITIK